MKLGTSMADRRDIEGIACILHLGGFREVHTIPVSGMPLCTAFPAQGAAAEQEHSGKEHPPAVTVRSTDRRLEARWGHHWLPPSLTLLPMPAPGRARGTTAQRRFPDAAQTGSRRMAPG
ncbi:hypothetical protein B5V46_18235 (plasmid) [Rhodovulum sp. MB263]|nr:hypothetical protein B5V46_18235 [Rhodovulum sp. MB263]